MIRLHQTFGAHAGRMMEFDRDIIRFGRLPDNEMPFDPHADLDASGRHAEMRREGGQWVIVDVGSRNGTLVGGRTVTRQVLCDGDEIEFGIGGPRVRVEIPRQNTSAPVSAGGFPTGPATPIAAPITPPLGGAAHPTPAPSLPVGSAPGVPLGQPMRSTEAMGGGSAPKRYGQKTVGLMIQAALQQAGQGSGGNRSTAYVRAVATEAAQSSSRGIKIALSLVAFLMFLTLGAVVALFFHTRHQEHELRDENVRLQRQLTDLGEGETAERSRLEGRIQELNDQLGEQEEATGSSIAERNAATVWALLSTRNQNRTVLCSAFAVRSDILATSAHCVSAIEREMERNGVVRAVANQGGTPAVIRQMWRHPRYRRDAPASPDVGLVRIAGSATRIVEIGTMSELHDLRAGDDLFVLGFPSALADNAAPLAGVTTGVVGRLTSFDGTDAPPVARHLVSHSAFSDMGTAGSPIFARSGHVIAINAGNVRTRRRVTDTGTRVTRTVESDAPYAWAVRADLLLQLLAGLPQ